MYKSSESTEDDSIVESDVISLFAGLVTGNYISLLARQSHGEMGSEAHGTSLNCFVLFHCVPLYVCRLCSNFQDLCANLLGDISLHIMLLTFNFCFVIDFLSI